MNNGVVRTGLSVTRNLGNFNSIKPEASFERPVRDGETVEEAFAACWEQVEAQIEAKILEAVEALAE